MHPGRIAAPHFIPVIAREFQLRGFGQLDLRVGDKIVEPSFAGGLLLEEPGQFGAGGVFGQPRKQRIVLPGPG